jgi:hypothetical protein
MISLREVVGQYEGLAKSFGAPVALSSFAIPNQDVSILFSAYDEDYHISRFLHFTNEAGKQFSINGFPATHISIDAGIKALL